MKLQNLAELFGCGKTQIFMIIKQKDSILSMYEANMSKTYKMGRNSDYVDVNKALYEWYTLACSRNIYPGGPQIAEKGRQIAARLGKTGFTGSNGWLEKWKSRYNIKQYVICGESGDVDGATIDSWKERLPELLQGYKKEDIMNLDETGCFWQALPTCGFNQKGKDCSGGKKSKYRITIAFIVSAAGKRRHLWSFRNMKSHDVLNGLIKTFFLSVTTHSQRLG